MARIKPASYLKEIRGRFGNIVHYNFYGRGYARVYVVPVNPDTAAQKIVRKTFGDGVRSWQTLSPEDQYKYNKKARRLAMSGYNLYISEFMKNSLHGEITAENDSRFIAQGKLIPTVLIPGSSVPSPYPLVSSSYSPSIQTALTYSAG